MADDSNTILAQYRLYPGLRKGLGNHITNPGDITGSSASVTAKIVINEGSGSEIIVEKPHLKLLGPGEIVGFDQRLVMRTEPQPNHTTFAPQYLSFIEFYEEDLPWRYTPLLSPPTGSGSLRPWLFLIVLKDDEFKELGQKIPFPLIQISGNMQLPVKTLRENQSQYWAHVQCTDQDSTKPPNPDRIISRIICPRHLEANNPYTGFLLPSFNTGIGAGGGNAEQHIYPVYYQWRFHTSNAVDFEYLVNLLEARVMPYEIGRRYVDFTKPRFGLNDLKSLTDLILEGPLIASEDAYHALDPSSTSETEEEKKLKKESVEQQVTLLKKNLASLAKRTSIAVNHGNDPELTIPFYGARYVINDVDELETVQLDGEIVKNLTWLHELNWESPGNRASAGMGTKIIRKHQDDYMARAWEQLESIVNANKTINLTEVMIQLVTRWQEQYLEPILKKGSLMYGQLLGPMFRSKKEYRMIFSADSCHAHAVLSVAFRRQMGTGMALGRNIKKNYHDGDDKIGLLDSLISGKIKHSFKHTLDNTVPVFNFEDASTLTDYLVPYYCDKNYKSDDKYPISIKPQKPCVDNSRIIEKFVTGVDFRKNFRNLLGQMYDGIQGYMDMDKLRLKPAMAYPHFDDPMFVNLRELGTDYLIANLDKVPNNTISILQSNQKFIESFMVGLNYELGKEMRWREYPTDERGSYFRQFWDTAGLVDYDGAKSEQVVSEKYKDISPIHIWEDIYSNNLGSHRERPPKDTDPPSPSQPVAAAGMESSTGNNIVLIIRGDLIRAFPNVTVYVVKAKEVGVTIENGKEVPDEDSVLVKWDENKIKYLNMDNDKVYPIFKAEVQPDVKFLGFPLTPEDVKGNGTDKLGYFFVLKEIPGELRLGLDISKETSIPSKSWDDLSWADLKDLDNGIIGESVKFTDDFITNFYDPMSQPTKEQWKSDAAQMVAIFYQKPVMMVIHASEMLPKPEKKSK